MGDLEQVKEYFKFDRFVKECNIEILEAYDGYCKCSMDIEDKLLNAMDSVHGGAIFTLADFTFAVAANFGGNSTVTQSASISYIRAGKGKILYAEAKKVNETKSTCVYKIEVTDENGVIIAFATGNGHIKR